MNSRWAPFLRLGIAAIIIIMIFSMPLREFMKVTVFIGVPFFLVLMFMQHQRRYSLTWLISLFILILIAGGYGYMLTKLPQKIENKAVKQIIGTGASLEAAGKYEAAIEKYRELEKYGRDDTMQDKIDEARQKQAGREGE